jgi:hypothetical protein
MESKITAAMAKRGLQPSETPPHKVIIKKQQ